MYCSENIFHDILTNKTLSGILFKEISTLVVRVLKGKIKWN